MYLAAPSTVSSPTCDAVDRRDDTGLRQRLWQQVKAAFPDVGTPDLRLEQRGGDHLLLIADETRAYRFPRLGTHGLALEIELLRQIADGAPVPVPHYDRIDPHGRFASYPLIDGVPLTAASFAAMPTTVAASVIDDAVATLRLLHGIDPAAIGPTASWPRMWSAGQFADRVQDDRLPAIAQQVPELIAPIEAFLAGYRVHHVPRQVVLHGDLVGDHLLVDANTGRLAGVIDFSDTALGDPACDFLGFWAFGASTAARAVAAYGGRDADPGLLARSRNHFIRYEVDRLFDMIVDGCGPTAIESLSASFAALLVKPTTHDTIRR